MTCTLACRSRVYVNPRSCLGHARRRATARRRRILPAHISMQREKSAVGRPFRGCGSQRRAKILPDCAAGRIAREGTFGSSLGSFKALYADRHTTQKGADRPSRRRRSQSRSSASSLNNTRQVSSGLRRRRGRLKAVQNVPEREVTLTQDYPNPDH